ncbi:hypothetical protein GCM10023166_26860 [Paeniglutamicibacter cryotolerans]|uniref:Helix-turn-helix domain-containing protein n=1 Tax=Paeniglutamicibacter cryotolerans TaxID=670079 RepID=A0A839QLB0_9MICC|nr:hypothetical protein [Paeniglutamicibacter cryotolerans]
MKDAKEIMEILAAYDLTKPFRATAELTGCSHHTVARIVKARDAGADSDQSATREGAHRCVTAQDRGMG